MNIFIAFFVCIFFMFCLTVAVTKIFAGLVKFIWKMAFPLCILSVFVLLKLMGN